MSAIDTLLNPRHRRACTYKAVKPFLSQPMPPIKLQYFQAPSRSERRKMVRETSLVCIQCAKKVAVVGAIDKNTEEVFCDNCAIDNYQVAEGFKTRAAAEAHRRRLFDVTYLLTERLFDKYLAKHSLQEEDLSVAERQELFDVSYWLDNMIPRPDKIKLQNEVDQSVIEHYYDRLIERWIVAPARRS